MNGEKVKFSRELLNEAEAGLHKLGLTLDTLKIPAPAYIHGHLVDPNGAAVEGGEIKLFQVVTSTGLCDKVAHAPAGCPIPAPLVGRGTSDGTGELRLAIPRP